MNRMIHVTRFKVLWCRRCRCHQMRSTSNDAISHFSPRFSISVAPVVWLDNRFTFASFYFSFNKYLSIFSFINFLHNSASCVFFGLVLHTQHSLIHARAWCMLSNENFIGSGWRWKRKWWMLCESMRLAMTPQPKIPPKYRIQIDVRVRLSISTIFPFSSAFISPWLCCLLYCLHCSSFFFFILFS